MKKLRLLVWEDCNRNCPGCCNKQWDLSRLPVVTDYTQFSEIMLTGGEPMLYPEKLAQIIDSIRQQTAAPIFVYTAHLVDWRAALAILSLVDGFTVTLHQNKDYDPFVIFDANRFIRHFDNKSLRLNVFEDIVDITSFQDWKMKIGIRWIENCPLPQDEVFGRFEEESHG